MLPNKNIKFFFLFFFFIIKYKLIYIQPFIEPINKVIVEL